MKTCEFCGKEFEPNKYAGRPQIYCSGYCKQVAQHVKAGRFTKETALKRLALRGATVPCARCGVAVTITRRVRNPEAPQYCSYDCSVRNRNTHDYHRNTVLKYLYNITIEDYDAMFAAQNGLCAICNEPPKGRRFSVDHNHKTGRVRGLLCNPCNIAVGHFEANPDAILKYLQRHGEGGTV
jgi:hypothetical protein